MGRPSKLTEKQWASIGERLLKGEAGRALAKEFGVSESAIRARLSAQVQEIKTVANQIVATNVALKAMPIAAQVTTHNRAALLTAIMDNMAAAAHIASDTTKHLAGIANAKSKQVEACDRLTDEDGLEEMKGIAMLTRMANEASMIPSAFAALCKDAIKDLTQEQRPQAQRVTVDVIDASLPDAEP